MGNDKNNEDVLTAITNILGDGKFDFPIVEKEKLTSSQNTTIANTAVTIANKLTSNSKVPEGVKQLAGLILLCIAAQMDSGSLQSKLIGASRNNASR